MRILVVEDEARIASFLAKGLGSAGYAVEHVGSGGDALAKAALGGFQLVILDLRLPDMEGFDVLGALRARGDQTPVIVLTARGDVHDRVRGLDLGADDYVTKPFAFDELLARVRARLRDTGRPPASDLGVLETPGLRLDVRTRRVDVDGEEATLTAREFALLETFMRHTGQVLSREQLLSQVWGYDFDPGTNVVDVYVGYLRKKIGARVETVRGMGYRLRA